MIAATGVRRRRRMNGGASEIVAAATLFATIVTKAVGMLRNMFDPNGRAPKWVWNLVSFALGITVALIWKINLMDNFGTTGIHGFSGQLVTGLAIAGSASGYHELFDTLSSTAKRAKAAALATDTAAVKDGAAELGVRGSAGGVENAPPVTS
jgi:uncharacterized membrane protein